MINPQRTSTIWSAPWSTLRASASFNSWPILNFRAIYWIKRFVSIFWVIYLRNSLLSDLQNCCWLSKTNISILHPRNIWKIEFIFDFWLIFYVEPFWPIPGPINIQVTFIMGFLPIFDQFLDLGETFFLQLTLKSFLIRIKAEKLRRIKAIWIPDSGKTNSCSNIF